MPGETQGLFSISNFSRRIKNLVQTCYLHETKRQKWDQCFQNQQQNNSATQSSPPVWISAPHYSPFNRLPPVPNAAATLDVENTEPHFQQNYPGFLSILEIWLVTFNFPHELAQVHNDSRTLRLQSQMLLFHVLDSEQNGIMLSASWPQKSWYHPPVFIKSAVSRPHVKKLLKLHLFKESFWIMPIKVFYSLYKSPCFTAV